MYLFLAWKAIKLCFISCSCCDLLITGSNEDYLYQLSNWSELTPAVFCIYKIMWAYMLYIYPFVEWEAIIHCSFKLKRTHSCGLHFTRSLSFLYACFFSMNALLLHFPRLMAWVISGCTTSFLSLSKKILNILSVFKVRNLFFRSSLLFYVQFALQTVGNSRKHVRLSIFTFISLRHHYV